MSREKLAADYKLFRFGSDGIGNVVHATMHEDVYKELMRLNESPITKVQLNQLLVLSKAGSMSDGFFEFYWRKVPLHPYDVKRLPYYKREMTQGNAQTVLSHDHLRWGLYRLYVDALLYFGNVAAAFNALRSQTIEQIESFFAAKRFDTEAISRRGPSLPLHDIAKDDRYLISEMVCKTFGELPADAEDARKLLMSGLPGKGGSPIKFRDLLAGVSEVGGKRDQLLLSFDDVLDTSVSDEGVLNKHFDEQFKKFQTARKKASDNTALYLSMVNDLDVYVATSMRSRQHFRDMAAACEKIFGDPSLEPYHLRYFDPTMSAAKGHEDKGLIECLMVKCAKVLIYSAGEKESYGKDAEAAMALSLGKPVIFYCDQGTRSNFYRDVHPLSRLIDFRSGVAVGAIVTDRLEDVAELVRRIFANEMEYEVKHHDNRPGYLKLHEKLTNSVVRLQTDDELLSTTFWNNYHNRQPRLYSSLAAGKEAERLQE